MSSAERILQNKELKWQKRREQRRKSFHKNKSIAKKTPKRYKENAGAIRQREYNERKRQRENRRLNRNEYMKDYRRRSSTLEMSDNGEHDGVFSNRMDKARSIKKLKLALPVNSVKRAAVLSAYVDEKRTIKSPAVEKFRSSIEKEKIETSAIQSIKEIITSVKHKRNKDAIASLQLVTSAVSGPKITNKKGAVKSLASKLGVNRKTIQKGKSFRAKVLHSGKSSFLYTSRKTRRDALDDTTKQLVHDFWLKESSSRPTNNKNDIKRVRLGPNIYSSHQCCILEKTQTEIYLDFIREYPEIKIGQRAFEKCKPYFVRPATQKDKLTCCCRHHVEMKSLFKSCMQFRKKTVIGKENCSFSLYGSLHELVDATLCPRSTNTHQHKMSCLNRECTECGVDKLDFLPEELDKNGTVEVSWERYEYQNVKIKGDKVVRKLVLVKKRSKACDMFDYLKQLLENFPSHQFRAYWQSKQMKSLINNLPVTHCVAIHDFSENYKCTEQCEIQSSYFQKQEVSIHVTILHRHAILEYDGIDSNENDPNIITEHFLVISPDQKHDHHFTHEVQKLIRDYLISISCDVSVMHEFTDGCSAQYKSRHCIGDISYGCSDLGYDKIVRNFFETSHARGPQDAAGGYIKKQADLSIIRGQRVIQSARNLYDFASENLCKTSEDAKCSRRIFRYIETINRNRDRYFKPVKENRKIHQVCSTKSAIVDIRKLSCYTCENCVNTKYNDCLNIDQIGNFSNLKMVKENADRESEDEEIADEIEQLYELVSIGTIFAVKADDVNVPYYLVKANKQMTVLRKKSTDKWGITYLPGSKVIHGYYFGIVNNNPLEQKLIKRIPAIVPALSVIYVCSELELSEDGAIIIDNSMHRSILRCLDY